MRPKVFRICTWVVAGYCLALPFTARAAEDDKKPAAAAQAATETTSDAEQKPDDPGAYYKGNRLPHARVRLELTTSFGFHSGRHPREGDIALRTNVDYEIPIVEHLTIAPRIVPLMFYSQDNDNDVWAAGIGVVFRGYSNGVEQRGWYGEVGLHLLGQTNNFEGNSGYANFMEELGVGYQFKKGWHISAKVSHISNAGIALDNAGVNNYGIGFGYSFKRD